LNQHFPPGLSCSKRITREAVSLCSALVRGFRVVVRRIDYVSSAARPAEEGRTGPLNARAMIDATIFALLVGAVSTPVAWWGISRFG
jgi:hypothetical protein